MSLPYLSLKPGISAQRMGAVRGASSIGLLLFACLQLHALIFFETGDPNHNTSPPIDQDIASIWKLQGQWLSFVGTPIAPKYFITAAHVGGFAGMNFSINGTTYQTRKSFTAPGSDLKIWLICGTFTEYAEINTNEEEKGREALLFGRGTQRGNPILSEDGILKGWLWGKRDRVLRWGRNRVSEVCSSNWKGNRDCFGDLLEFNFDAAGEPDEVHLSVGDSGGGVFLKSEDQWKLAGVNYAVSGPYRKRLEGGDVLGSIFDEGGLHLFVDGWNFMPDESVDLPGTLYATRIFSGLDWIQKILDAPVEPDEFPELHSAANVHGPFHKKSSAIVTQSSVQIILDPDEDQRFFRLSACCPLVIDRIRQEESFLVLYYHPAR